MRNAFAAEVTALAKEESRLVVLSGDIGNRLFDDFKAVDPARFFNCGVAEANMIGVAAGMAMSGLKPVVYTINSFLTGRPYEQIRLDVCYHNLPVVLVGVGGGLGYASLGPTHHSLEDVALMRSLPHMNVVCPGDPVEVKLALRAALKKNEPVFIRLGKKGEPVVHAKIPASFEIGKALPISEGSRVCILSTGEILPVAVAAGKELTANGISTGVVSFHTVKPLDEALLAAIFSRYQLVATVEEHTLIGGFGSAVAEWRADHPEAKARLVRFGGPDEYLHEACELDYARERFGLTEKNIIQKIKISLGD